MMLIVARRMMADFIIILVISCPIYIFLMRLLRLAEEMANLCSSSVISELRFSKDRKLPDVEEYCV